MLRESHLVSLVCAAQAVLLGHSHPNQLTASLDQGFQFNPPGIRGHEIVDRSGAVLDQITGIARQHFGVAVVRLGALLRADEVCCLARVGHDDPPTGFVQGEGDLLLQSAGGLK